MNDDPKDIIEQPPSEIIEYNASGSTIPLHLPPEDVIIEMIPTKPKNPLWRAVVIISVSLVVLLPVWIFISPWIYVIDPASATMTQDAQILYTTQTESARLAENDATRTALAQEATNQSVTHTAIMVARATEQSIVNQTQTTIAVEQTALAITQTAFAGTQTDFQEGIFATQTALAVLQNDLNVTPTPSASATFPAPADDTIATPTERVLSETCSATVSSGLHIWHFHDDSFLPSVRLNRTLRVGVSAYCKLSDEMPEFYGIYLLNNQSLVVDGIEIDIRNMWFETSDVDFDDNTCFNRAQKTLCP